MYKIIFMGTPEFSVPILEALAAFEQAEVVAVVTQPDRKVGRKKIVTPPPVKQAAIELKLPVWQPEKLSGSEEMEQLLALKPDLIVTAAYGQYVPTKLLQAPPFRAINVHASLLPKYRGAAPIHSAIINGDKKTGITIMYMEKEMDAGNIIAQYSIPITKQDDVGTMFEKLSLLGKDCLIDTLPSIFDQSNDSIPQKTEEVTYAPMIHAEQEKIDWTKTAVEIDNMVRGLRPFPGSHTILEGKRFKIWSVEPVEQKATQQPGEIEEIRKDAIVVACGEQTLLALYEIQPSGKQRMKSINYLTGAGSHLKKGTRFGE
ncbi:methionyl-tRNA formyltransferase [Marinilactibacillus piezotolerans]|uniref:Methionyl-tRNA formyltransferase n=1 Tax=Marinilactibacillus piezotolerans TaxID=258723 RepID=A0A1I3VN28_9LACT|nr:methionyl-tRNA formyltransferase [Marinilactibacillus piezotolerans]SFJ96499.1 methionyl-tRNA formyltransferase [Marinilactibacillus piezotolerans]